MRGVALMAQEGDSDLEKVFCCRAVRIMAIAAIFIDRFVVVYERAAFFHVTGVAGVDDAIALHQLRTGRAMGIVAIRASDLTFQHGVMRWLVCFDALLLVTGEANFRLGFLVAYLVMPAMNVMAGCAGDVTSFVNATRPQVASRVFLVASQTSLVASAGRCIAFLAKVQVCFGGVVAPE